MCVRACVMCVCVWRGRGVVCVCMCECGRHVALPLVAHRRQLLAFVGTAVSQSVGSLVLLSVLGGEAWPRPRASTPVISVFLCSNLSNKTSQCGNEHD